MTVLAREPYLVVDRWPARPPVRVSPAAATSCRCQRSSVCGVTKNACHERRGSTRLNTANTSRSACVSCGRRACRRRIANSWRSTRISSFHRVVTTREQQHEREQPADRRRRRTTRAQSASEDGAADATALPPIDLQPPQRASRSSLCTPPCASAPACHGTAARGHALARKTPARTGFAVSVQSPGGRGQTRVGIGSPRALAVRTWVR
jgi:hypothetical protein